MTASDAPGGKEHAVPGRGARGDRRGGRRGVHQRVRPHRATSPSATPSRPDRYHTAGPRRPGLPALRRNYPSLIAPDLDLPAFRDVSCSGAQTKDMTQAQDVDPDPDNPPQFDALNPTRGSSRSASAATTSASPTSPRPAASSASRIPSARRAATSTRRAAPTRSPPGSTPCPEARCGARPDRPRAPRRRSSLSVTPPPPGDPCASSCAGRRCPSPPVTSIPSRRCREAAERHDPIVTVAHGEVLRRHLHPEHRSRRLPAADRPLGRARGSRRRCRPRPPEPSRDGGHRRGGPLTRCAPTAFRSADPDRPTRPAGNWSRTTWGSWAVIWNNERVEPLHRWAPHRGAAARADRPLDPPLGTARLRRDALHRAGERRRRRLGGLQHSTIGIGERLTVGYVVAPEVWGGGHASAIATASVAYAFDVLGAVELHVSVLSTNAASRRVLEKAGLRVDRDVDHGDHIEVIYVASR